jgi:hypothetical protein
MPKKQTGKENDTPLIQGSVSQNISDTIISKPTPETSRKLGEFDPSEYDKIMHILGKQTDYPEFVKLNSTKKRALEPEDTRNMRNLTAMNFRRMGIKKMRTWCDELYLSMDRDQRVRRLGILKNLGNSVPEEFPPHLIDDMLGSQWFQRLFTEGGEDNTPSKLFDKFLHVSRVHFAFDYSEYMEQHERLYYTGMLKALLDPMGGNKRRRTRRRRKHRK